MATTEHRRTNGHEVCNSMVSIADELPEVSGLLRDVMGSGMVPLGDYLQLEPI